MNDETLIEMLIRLTDEVRQLREQNPLSANAQLASRNLLEIQRDRLVREQHRLGFQSENKQ